MSQRGERDGRRAGDRVTIYEVAAVAGVSYGTVSRVLNGGPASATARRAVRRALTATGYVPNQRARRLAGARPDAVAFLHCVDAQRRFGDPNVNGLLLACHDALAEHDLVMVTPIGVDGPADVVTRRVAARIFDPVLLFGAPAAALAVADLVDRQLPVVACGLPLGYERQVSYVTTDDRDGARQIVAYLRSRGRRRIAIITGPMQLPGGVQRLAGYQDAIGTDFDPALVAHGDYTHAGAAAATVRLLRQVPDLDAIFAASDMMATGALTTLQHAGRRVPDDVAVAGYDDAPIATSAQLTTVRIPWQRYPGQLIRHLQQRMNGDEPSGIVMPVELIIRGST
jgi:DNA-binding LacI/PurR family transcriptional regulator